jgi:hypothetical protein
VQEKLGVSERRACGVIAQPRATQRRVLKLKDDEEALTAAIITLACPGMAVTDTDGLRPFYEGMVGR